MLTHSMPSAYIVALFLFADRGPGDPHELLDYSNRKTLTGMISICLVGGVNDNHCY